MRDGNCNPWVANWPLSDDKNTLILSTLIVILLSNNIPKHNKYNSMYVGMKYRVSGAQSSLILDGAKYRMQMSRFAAARHCLVQDGFETLNACPYYWVKSPMVRWTAREG